MVELFPPPFDESPKAPTTRHRPQHDRATSAADENRGARLSAMERLDGYVSLFSRWAGPAVLGAALILIGWLFLR
ncbi:hypothetical protein SAMN02927924_00160 [Sphingobium faniae]|nr:hypothetical protein SAMN02927924_00160 [Sphingobium faniae]